jgi:prevent-host-death family protein
VSTIDYFFQLQLSHFQTSERRSVACYVKCAVGHSWLCHKVVLICTTTFKERMMPIIKSISSLRNRTRKIAAICHKEDEPVYTTTNGEGDLVVMSIDHYERLKAQVQLFEKLGVAQSQSAAAKKGIIHRQMIAKLRRRAHAR